MKRISEKSLILAMIVFFSVCEFACAADDLISAHAELMNAQGERVGSAKLTEDQGGVRIALHVENLLPGAHAFHVHEMGKCEGPDFKSAGGHFNPYQKKHGLKNPEGHHLGDMEDVQVGADGTGETSAFLQGATLGEGVHSLFHLEGSAVVIHESTDDGMSDPAGNAGARIACGVVTKD